MKIKSLLLMGCVALVLACSGGEASKVQLIPQPASVQSGSGALDIEKIASVSLPKQWAFVGENFAQGIKDVVAVEVLDNGGVVSVVEDASIAPQAYKLKTTKKGVEVKAADLEGVNNAFSTLAQLMRTAQNGNVAIVEIEDSPRFAYRGLMLDCSRHFWTVDELKQSIDQMAFFKLNKLHLHLTDNNAWRMAMDKYPDLVTKGTYYYDFPELSGKYYTKEDLKEVVRYAGERGIEVIPEVDLPGHTIALMAARPELSCRGGEFEAYPEERELNKRKRGNENMICVGNPQSLEFVAEVVDALVEIFPSKYIHLGGDEVPTKVWEKCPKCQKLYNEKGMTEAGQIQDYFTREAAKIIRSRGKVMVGWDEINERGAATPEDVVMVWRNTGEPFQKDALENGVPVIMVPQHGCYFDWGYAGNSTRKVYEWDPVQEHVTAEQLPLILGAQGALWTERVPTQDRLEWMLYPRLTALSEVMWTAPEKKNWDDFYQRVTAYYPVMAALGINYYEDDAMNEAEFAPTKEKPALVRHAFIETNIPNNFPYHPEYAFDGRTNSFYWGGSSIGEGHYFTVLLGEPTAASSIEVITGDSKDYITMADLQVSTDGETFTTVAKFDEYGAAKVTLDGTPIKAVKINVTGQHTCWPIIKEIIIK